MKSVKPKPTQFDGLLPAGAHVAQATSESWEWGLTSEERRIIAGAVNSRIREFTAGRNCARVALALAGCSPCSILIGKGRAPAFPQGFSGTITHTRGYCAAAVIRVGAVLSIGIDAETNDCLDDGVAAMISTPAEREMLRSLQKCANRNWGKLLFSIKEAFFKAYFQLSQEYLDFHDARVDIAAPAGAFSITPLTAARPFQGRLFSGRFSMDEQYVYAALAISQSDLT